MGFLFFFEFFRESCFEGPQRLDVHRPDVIIRVRCSGALLHDTSDLFQPHKIDITMIEEFHVLRIVQHLDLRDDQILLDDIVGECDPDRSLHIYKLSLAVILFALVVPDPVIA